MKGKIIFEWLFWTLLSLLLFTTGVAVSVLSPLMILAAPVPVMILTCRLGVGLGGFGALAGTAAVLLSLGPVSAVMFTCEFGLLGFAMGILIQKLKSGADYMFAAIAASLAVKVMLMVVFTRAVGYNPFLISADSAEEILGSLSGALSQGGVEFSKQSIKEYAELMVSTVTLMMPSMLILFAAADSLVSYALTKLYFKRVGGLTLPSLPPFSFWRFPKNIFWALLATLVLDMAAKALPDQTVFKMLSVNMMEVLRGVFLVEGLSLLWYFMSSRHLNTVLKVVLIIVCTLFAPVSYILSMLGIFDIWYDLRRRIKLRGKNQ